jgi:hypothetical protein
LPRMVAVRLESDDHSATSPTMAPAKSVVPILLLLQPPLLLLLLLLLPLPLLLLTLLLLLLLLLVLLVLLHSYVSHILRYKRSRRVWIGNEGGSA